MIEVSKVAYIEEAKKQSKPISCYVCGVTTKQDPDLKRLAFGKKDKASAGITLCSCCANQLSGLISIC